MGLDIAFIAGGSGTARYVALHDKDGELVSAAADMEIITKFRDEDIHLEIERGNPKFLAFDGNISPRTVNTIIKSVKPDTKGALPLPSLELLLMEVLFEPTSVPKARKLFEKPVELGLFPKHSVSIVTPNILELRSLYEAADENEFFAGSEWWSILDGFGITSQFRDGTFSFVFRNENSCKTLRCC
jgi:pseudouridine-5'-phosphate glycosidase/pseudouridine kinase